MKMMRFVRYAFVAAVFCVAWSARPADAQPVVGGHAPGFALPALSGETIDLADLRGQIVVLHFGAGW
jgi:cytochrome oxidase Cu insertion factor (SCO1/SenC/PrrC family)